jgi:hypothetical protein
MTRLTLRAAEDRFRELLNEATLLIELFPQLRDAFDEDELPLPFILARGAGRLRAEGIKPAPPNGEPSHRKGASRSRRSWADRRMGQKGYIERAV